MRSSKRVLDKSRQVPVDVFVVLEPEFSAGPRHLPLVVLVGDQLLVVPRHHDVPPVAPGDYRVPHSPGIEVVSVHYRGPEHGEAVSRKRDAQSPPQHLPDPRAAGLRELVYDVEGYNAGQQVHHAGPDKLVLLLVNLGVEVQASYLFRLAPVTRNTAGVPGTKTQRRPDGKST